MVKCRAFARLIFVQPGETGQYIILRPAGAGLFKRPKLLGEGCALQVGAQVPPTEETKGPAFLKPEISFFRNLLSVSA